jgi:phosphoenolpyruvate synthase/pyruvate phosphate dikinase
MLFTAASYCQQPTQTPKAAMLAQLQNAGQRVPAFVVITPNERGEIASADIHAANALLGGTAYAVRFSAYDEDGMARSQAGKYVTRLAVKASELEGAVHEVVEQSIRTAPDCGVWHVIIQVFIAAISSGVIFTRHPQQSNAMLIEWGAGAGSVVSGEGANTLVVTAELQQTAIPRPFSDLVTRAKEIERMFAWPQDIEWCYDGVVTHIVQTRPITTITVPEWQGIQRIDAHHFTPPYHFIADTNIEAYLTATTLDIDVLRHLHTVGGPIDLWYQNLQLIYDDTAPFTQVGGRLYSNTIREKQALFPSFRLRLNGKLGMSLWPLSKLLITAKNHATIQRILKKPHSHIASLIAQLETDFSETVSFRDFAQTFAYVMAKYKTVYGINFFCRNCTASLDNDPQYFQEISSMWQLPSDLAVGTARGNSFLLADQSPFFAVPLSKDKETLSDTLRELARWQSVRLRNLLYGQLELLAEKYHIPIAILLYATISELLDELFDEKVLTERLTTYESLAREILPDTISSSFDQKENGSTVLSVGAATGIVVSHTDIAPASSGCILFVEQLTPEVVHYYPRVVGVMCRRGSVLSHAAIVARELSLPVIQSAQCTAALIGHKVELHPGGFTIL